MATNEKKKTSNAKAAGSKRQSKKQASSQPKALRIKLIRSVIGSSPRQRAVVAGLGLRRMNQVVERKDTREIRGMVNKVPHLVQIIS